MNRRRMLERFKHNIKGLPDYIETKRKEKGSVVIKFSDSHCEECQKEKWQEDADGKKMERGNESLQILEGLHARKKEMQKFVCPNHKQELELQISSFNVWEYRIKHFATSKIETLDVAEPPTVPSPLWDDWAVFWNSHKAVYISLSWIHHFRAYCLQESVLWLENVFNFCPSLEEEIRYCDYIHLSYSEDFVGIDWDDEERSNGIIDDLWRELCLKRFWIQFRLYLRNKDFDVVEELKRFFETKGIFEDPIPIERRNFVLFIPIGVLSYKCTRLFMYDTSEDDDPQAPPSTLDISKLTAAEIRRLGRKSDLTVEGLQDLRNLDRAIPRASENLSEVYACVGIPRQKIIIESSHVVQAIGGPPPRTEEDQRGERDCKIRIEVKDLSDERRAANVPSPQPWHEVAPDDQMIRLEFIPEEGLPNLIAGNEDNAENPNAENEDNVEIPIAGNENNAAIPNTENEENAENLITRKEDMASKNLVVLWFSSCVKTVLTLLIPRSIFGFRYYRPYSNFWQCIYKFYSRYKTLNIMQRMEKECVSSLKNLFKHELERVLFYPPLMSCKTEHLTNLEQSRPAKISSDDRLRRICLNGEEDRRVNKPSIIKLDNSDQQLEDFNKLRYGDGTSMEFVKFEEKIYRNLQTPTGEDTDMFDEPPFRTSSALNEAPPQLDVSFIESVSLDESFLEGRMVVHPPDINPADALDPIDVKESPIGVRLKKWKRSYVKEILSMCELMTYDYKEFLEDRCRPANFDENFIPYWLRRYRLSSLYGEGILIKNDCWYRTPPEIILKNISKRFGYRKFNCVLDAFSGAGLSAIQLALHNINKVYAFEENEDNGTCATENAAIYGVYDKITFITADFRVVDDNLLELLDKMKPEAIFLNPPIRNPDCWYKEYDVLSLGGGGASDCKDLLDFASMYTRNIVLYLPPFSNIPQVLEVARPFGKVEIEFNQINNEKESMCVYFGAFAY